MYKKEPQQQSLYYNSARSYTCVPRASELLVLLQGSECATKLDSVVCCLFVWFLLKGERRAKVSCYRALGPHYSTLLYLVEIGEPARYGIRDQLKVFQRS